MAEIVRTERHGAVLEVILDRPPVNAINDAVSGAINRAFTTLRDDPELRVGILTSAGDRVFSAGWDLMEVARAASGVEVNDAAMAQPGGFGGITEFWDLYKPVVAAVNGIAVGGGFELALACDVIVMAENAWFQLPEMLRGLVPDAGAIQRLPRLLPYNVAMEMMLTGRRMDAAEAVRWGLVHAAVPPAEVMGKARELALAIAEGAPLAVEALLEVVPAIVNLPEEEAFARTKRGRSGLPRYERMIESEDFLEGPRAFAEKRKPVWKGR
jgi:crotonobetainyl-CoA hydratase